MRVQSVMYAQMPGRIVYEYFCEAPLGGDEVLHGAALEQELTALGLGGVLSPRSA